MDVAMLVSNVSLIVILAALVFLCASVIRLSRILELSKATTGVMAVLCFVIGIVPVIYLHIKSDKVLETPEQKERRRVADEFLKKQGSRN